MRVRLNYMFMHSWSISLIKHIEAGGRYGSLWVFRCGQKVSYRQTRYAPEDFNDIDHADNNLVNRFFGFFVLAVILILIAK